MTKKTESVEVKEVVIKNVVVKIGDREIVLTIEEAKKLKDALEGIFGKEVIKETKIIHEHEYDWYREPFTWPKPSYPKPWYDGPMWKGDPEPPYRITCDAGEAGKVFNSSAPKGQTMFLDIKK
jgi:hypothetical protein